MTTHLNSSPGALIGPSGDESGTVPEDRAFRPDVQGLRAVAVALVVLFHAHVPGLTGGYVGVDVFFVISGFVITGVLLRENASTGSTSLLRFYGRRARRIIPAATLVIIASVIVSYALLGSLGGNQTANDGRWASVFLVNFHFASAGTNYLASQLPPSVLQNYWSLAVEEQFYLVYPLIFLITAGLSWRLPLRARLGIVLAVAVVGSFIASVIETSQNPTAAYFLPYPRVWELALGGLVAVCTVSLRRLPETMAAALSWLGLGSIILSAFVLTSATPYPGWAVALPVVGAALVLTGGAAEPTYGVELLLRQGPFQWVGLISYSLYLWHWPVLTIAAERNGSDNLSAGGTFLCVLISLGLASLTYFLVENPIRHSRALVVRRWTSVALGACLVVTSLVVGTIELHEHPQANSAVSGLANLKTSDLCPSPPRKVVTSLMGVGPKTSHHVVARVLLVGDSTACTMLPGMEAVAGPLGVKVENGAVIGCGVVSGTIAPQYLNGTNINGPSKLCQRKANIAEARALRSGRPNVVVWGSTWERNSLVVGTGSHQKVLVAGSPQWTAVVMERMEQRVAEFTATGATVILLTQAPFVDPGKPTRPTASDKTFARLNALLTRFASNRPHVELIDLANYVCPTGAPCSYFVGRVFERGDGAHFTSEGSLFVARWLMPQLGIPALDTRLTPLPTLRIAVPKSGMLMKGTKPLAAEAPFNLGVVKTQYEITGKGRTDAILGSATLGDFGWVLYWHTKRFPNGTYTLRAVASNAAGDHSVSPGVTVRVAN
jgi:peptidoglycan/LPS O-acetylase OafA/YrhL